MRETCRFKFEIPYVAGVADKNGILYSEKALREAALKAKNIPLKLNDPERVIGNIERVEFFGDRIVAEGVCMGGSEEMGDMIGNIVTGMEFVSFGIDGK